MSRTLQLLYAVGITAGVCLVAIFAISSTRDAHSTGAVLGAGGPTPVGADWITEDPPARVGITFKPATAPAQIGRDKAIEIANGHALSMGGQAKGAAIHARYVLMSNGKPEVGIDILQQKGLGYHKTFTDIPVWVVSYEGLNMLGSHGTSPNGVEPTPGPQDYNHEQNVIVSAENGEILGAYTYR